MSREREKFAEDGRIQFHWQSTVGVDQTILVSEVGFSTIEGVSTWIREIIESRQRECPKGWIAMICDSRSSYFCGG